MSAPPALALVATPPTVVVLTAGELAPWPDLLERDATWHANGRGTVVDRAAIAFAASVEARGILNPLLVALRPDGAHWIVDGRRRWAAAKRLGIAVPCVVRAFTLEEALAAAVVANVQQRTLNPIEEARALRRWLAGVPGATQTSVAAEIGKTQPYVANRLRLLALPEPTRALVESRALSPSVARDFVLPIAGRPAELEEVTTRLKARVDAGQRIGKNTVRDTVIDVLPERRQPPGVRVYQELGSTEWWVAMRFPVASQQEGLRFSREVNDTYRRIHGGTDARPLE